MLIKAEEANRKSTCKKFIVVLGRWRANDVIFLWFLYGRHELVVNDAGQ